jgi:hypothetical protein
MKMGEEMKFHVTINDRVSSELVKIGSLQKGINKGGQKCYFKIKGSKLQVSKT